MSDEIRDPHDFIRQIVAIDRAAGKHGGHVVTRFPPEPNGYLHIGHAKSICLNFGIAHENDGVCHLRLDDTNPSKEDLEYVEAIQQDIHWLGFDWDLLRHASDYFEVFYRGAEKLIRTGKAYVCDLDADSVRTYRGTLTEAGRNSPYRNRSVEDNLDLLQRMRAGEFAEGAKTLRTKIDMAAGNINLRDPAIYRIRKIPHQHTGDAWCIYPMYDYAHCVSDAIEGITHSLCTLEFEDHRPLYDWFLQQLDLPGDPALTEPLRQNGQWLPPSTPRQIEFARLNIDYTILSKRKLMALVRDKLVTGWDDPRMPTLCGMRRRGFTPAAIRDLIQRIGVTKQNSVIEFGLLESCVRDDLDSQTPRRLVVLDPLKLVLSNWPDRAVETLQLPNHPKDASFGVRQLAVDQELWIEQEDFSEDPPKGFRRLVPGGEVRLRGIGIVRCNALIRDSLGRITELDCTLDPDSRPGLPGANRKVKGTIHWVSVRHAIQVEIRLYDRLFDIANPDQVDEGKGYQDHLNPDSLQILKAWAEPSLAAAEAEQHYQFERLGYFVADRYDHRTGTPVFNRTLSLRDSWSRRQQG